MINVQFYIKNIKLNKYLEVILWFLFNQLWLEESLQSDAQHFDESSIIELKENAIYLVFSVISHAHWAEYLTAGAPGLEGPAASTIVLLMSE